MALRDPILRSALSLGVAFVVGLFLAQSVIRLIIQEAGFYRLAIGGPIAPSSSFVQVAFHFTLGMTSPIIIYHFAYPLAPGWTRTHNRPLVSALAVLVVLFVAGALLALFEAAPRILSFLHRYIYSDFTFSVDPDAVATFYLSLIVAFGLMFQLPATVFLLAKLNLIRRGTVRVARGIAIPTVVAIAALITETVDPISLAIVTLPLYLAFELGIVLSHLFAFPKPGLSPPRGVGAPPADRGASTPPDIRGPIPSRPRRVAEP